MGKRVRIVHPPEMVAHLWAHEAQDEAKTPKNGNLFFRFDTIYSYGYHFPIARIVTIGKRKAVLFTTKDYSSTTAGHKSCVRGACRHLPTFCVDEVGTDYRVPAAFNEAWEAYKSRLTEHTRKFVKARLHKSWHWTEITSTVKEANEFAAFFGRRCRLQEPDEGKAKEAIKKADAKQRIVNAEKAAKRKAEQEAYAAEQAKRLEAWLGGDNNYYRASYGDPIRLRIAGDRLQTTMGAEVPVEDAKRVYRILQKLRKRGESYQRNGTTISLGPFALDSMDESGTVTAGCHTVAWAEVERVAKLAGL